MVSLKEKKKLSVRKQVVKNYLIKWYYLDTNIEHLNEAELVKMKILYASLKHLDKKELEFLAAKYRVERKPYITDAVAAQEQQMSLKDYKKERIRIEGKLRYPIGKYIDKYKKELSQATQLVYGK